MYYIYHIPGVKIGCSMNPKKRVQQQGYSDFVILEQHSDVKIVSDREMELQKEFGYRIDNVRYDVSKYTEIGKRHTIPVIATQLSTGIQKEFDSLTECANEIGIGIGRITHILSPKYKRKSTYGWTFNYKTDLVC